MDTSFTIMPLAFFPLILSLRSITDEEGFRMVEGDGLEEAQSERKSRVGQFEKMADQAGTHFPMFP